MHLFRILFVLPVALAIPYTKVHILEDNYALADIADVKVTFEQMKPGNDQKVENEKKPLSSIPSAPVLPPLNGFVLLFDIDEDMDKSTKDKIQKPSENSKSPDDQDDDIITSEVRKLGFLKPSKIISFLSGIPLPFPFSLLTSVPSQLSTIFSKPKYYVPYMVMVDDTK